MIIYVILTHQMYHHSLQEPLIGCGCVECRHCILDTLAFYTSYTTTMKRSYTSIILDKKETLLLFLLEFKDRVNGLLSLSLI